MKKSPYGPCGLYCGACAATDCDGCLSARIDAWVRNCRFRNCSRDRGVDFCCYCSEYPCPDLRKFMTDKWPHHWTMARNLEYIKNNGVEKWLQAQQQEWSCPNCRAAIFWYQKNCECGQSLDAFELPEDYRDTVQA